MKKETTFTEGKIMQPLISSAVMQSISAFAAQNYGAGRMDRAKKALHYGTIVSFVIGLATPISSALQLILCVGFMFVLNRKK